MRNSRAFPDRVYLDHAASSPLLEEVRGEMIETLGLHGNPSSVHKEGRDLARLIEGARVKVARAAGASRNQVVFTGSATEALTQAIVGGVRALGLTRIVVSAGEHSAVRRAAEICGVPFEVVGLDGSGSIDMEALSRAVHDLTDAGHTALIVVHQVNNETGVVQDIGRIGALVGPTPHYLVVDGVQGFCRLPVDFASGAIDMMAVSAHKIGGPAGVGALFVKEHCDQVCLVPGGGQELGRRGGTPSAALISGFGVAADIAPQRFERNRLSALIERFEKGLRGIVPGVAVFGEAAERAGNISSFALPGLSSETALMGLDLKGISVSAGSACSSGKLSASRVLGAMGIDEETAGCALRVSVGWNSSEKDVDRALGAIREIYQRATGVNEDKMPLGARS